MSFSALSDYLNANAPMSNIPELLNLHHSNPLGLHPIVIPIFLLVLAIIMRIIIYLIHKKDRKDLQPKLLILWCVSLFATYYYCFSGDLPLFRDIDLNSTEICIGWFCQRQVVGVGWSLLGVVMLSFVTYCMITVMLHLVSIQSDRMGLGENEWREWYWIIILMLVGASAAGIADDFAPITGIWILIAYLVAIIVTTVIKMVIDTVRTRRFGNSLVCTVFFLISFEAITMLAIECIEGYIYLFIPIVALFASADHHFIKKSNINQ